MLSTGVHTSLEETPSTAMFSRDERSKPNTINEHTAVMDGMVTVIDTLCQALTPKKSEIACTTLPGKKNEASMIHAPYIFCHLSFISTLRFAKQCFMYFLFE